MPRIIVFPRHKKIVHIALVMLTLSTVCAFLFFTFGERRYVVANYQNDPSAERGLFSYDLGELRLFFAGEKTLDTEVAGMVLLHSNDFWDPERCAGMIPSIFENVAFFVDRKIEVQTDGRLMKKSFIYRFDFTTMTLSEIAVPFLIERVYMHNGKYYVARIVNAQFVFIYIINEHTQKLSMRKLYHIPDTHKLITGGQFLRWCNSNLEYCIIKEDYLGFDVEGAMLLRAGDERARTYAYQGEGLIVSNTHKNLFLGYSLSFPRQSTK